MDGFPAVDSAIAPTPEPPYLAVIFTSLRAAGDDGGGYAATAAALRELAGRQDGYLGMESVEGGVGITVSYWRDEAAALSWKRVAAHREAQRLGRRAWYRDYRVRVATVTHGDGAHGDGAHGDGAHGDGG